jgi:hypothetical protein
MNASYLLLKDVASVTPNRQTMPGSMTGAPVGVHPSCCREIMRLHSENARLTDELERIRGEHEDLTRSAEIWIRLYETYFNLATARAASNRLAKAVGQ